ncbi:MAG TPA: class I SAM-dependent methyltransferase [Pyrinomonadaceae bacterium]|jgi:ubiquinone/menaquinone biosynthesis C-methylase UbiE|nr:class I SAM-dependent methyltransferase [Pyrinomonadaceae bacterium]
MAQNSSITTVDDNRAGSLYDRIARLYDLTFKFNGYGRSLERYFREHPIPLPDDNAQILDAGCGTGLLTLAMLRTLTHPAQITAIDLSASSLHKARQAVGQELQRGRRPHRVRFLQANLLSLPFANETFDFIATSGALEYVSLRDGLGELARVLKSGGHLFHLPVRPAPASAFLELLFRFKTHPPREVDENTERYLRIVSRYRFPPTDIIGWTKIAITAQKP